MIALSDVIFQMLNCVTSSIRTSVVHAISVLLNIIIWQERMFKWSCTAQSLVTVLLLAWGWYHYIQYNNQPLLLDQTQLPDLPSVVSHIGTTYSAKHLSPCSCHLEHSAPSSKIMNTNSSTNKNNLRIHCQTVPHLQQAYVSHNTSLIVMSHHSSSTCHITTTSILYMT